MHRALSPFQNTSTCSVFHLHFQLGKGTWLISKGPRQVVVKEGVRLNRKLSPPTHTHTGCPETELSPQAISLSLVLFQPQLIQMIFSLFLEYIRDKCHQPKWQRGECQCVHIGQAKVGNFKGQGVCVCVCVKRVLGFHFIIKQHLY